MISFVWSHLEFFWMNCPASSVASGHRQPIFISLLDPLGLGIIPLKARRVATPPDA